MLDATQGAYQTWKSGTKDLNLETIVKIAKLLDTSVDFFVGQTTDRRIVVVPKPITRIYVKNIKNFYKEELYYLKFAIVMSQIKKFYFSLRI